jgi:hypothetical protein
MFVDGGINFLILDAKTGRKIKEIVMDDKDPYSDEQLQLQHEILSMPQAKSDLLTCDGKKIYMGKQDFDLEGNRLELKNSTKEYSSGKTKMLQFPLRVYEDNLGEGSHLMSGTGLLDTSWWHRTYWTYGKNYTSGHYGYWRAGKSAPSGRILCFDNESIFGYGRMNQYYRWSKEYEYYLYNRSLENEEKWGVRLPILVRAMVAAKDRLYAFGPQELYNQKKMIGILDQAASQKLVKEQDDAFNGKSGAIFLVINRENGTIENGYNLHTTPVFDGLASAYNKLFISMSDGSVVCLGNQGQNLDAVTDQQVAAYNDAAKIDAPKGTKKKKPAFKSGGSVPTVAKQSYSLEKGKKRSGEQTPQIGGQPFSVTVNLTHEGGSGVLVAQGGDLAGYALDVKEDMLTLYYRNDRKLIKATASKPLSKSKHTLVLKLSADKEFSLTCDGEKIIQKKVPSLLMETPLDGAELGSDTSSIVGDYGKSNRYPDPIEGAVITVGQ